MVLMEVGAAVARVAKPIAQILRALRDVQVNGGTETVESHLHDNQMTHLNAEIASAGTYMGDISVCLRWLK